MVKKQSKFVNFREFTAPSVKNQCPLLAEEIKEVRDKFFAKKMDTKVLGISSES